MVQTRRQYRNWVDNRATNYQTSQSSCSSCTQNSSNTQDNGDWQRNDPPNYEQRNGVQYRSNDGCKRHRLNDSDPYSERVVSYSRRKPVR